jgi:hypothetical protein
MTTALCVFAATYICVFTLGLQSLNVNQGHYVAAAVTSFFIGTGNIYLYKYMPGADALDLSAYYAGGIAGITSSIWFHRRARAWLAAMRARIVARLYDERGAYARRPAAVVRDCEKGTALCSWPSCKCDVLLPRGYAGDGTDVH